MSKDREIEIQDLTVDFVGAAVLRGFEMQLEAGEKVLVTGKSGCGKSTLLRSIIGLIEPQDGTIHVRGTALGPETVWHIRSQVAMVAQEPDIGQGSVQEVLERPFHYKANSHLKGNLEGAARLMEQFHLSGDMRNKAVEGLSGGEKQRVALVGALLLDRPILLLDEPTSALDPTSMEAVAEYLADRGDLTVLTVAHNAAAFAFVDRTIEMAPISQMGKSHEHC